MKADSFCLESFLDCMQPSGAAMYVHILMRVRAGAAIFPFPLIANVTVAGALADICDYPNERLAPFEPVMSNV